MQEETRLMLAEKIYGEIPKRPIHLDYTVKTADGGFAAGKATLAEYEILMELSDRTVSMPMTAVIPNGRNNIPAIISLTDKSGVPNKYLPAEEIIDRGYAIFQIQVDDIACNNADFKAKICGQIARSRKRRAAPGKIAVWAFGLMRAADTVCDLVFRVSPKSFFQVNRVQTEVLYNKAREFANLHGKERVLDAYCGTGTIGLIMARDAKTVIGVESNRDAVRDAVVNAELNGIDNIQFVAADAGDFMAELAANGTKIDVAITDPPRAGCSPKFLKNLIILAPKRVVYISCNPETLARDLYTLRNGGYKVQKIQPVDMFPYTAHIETVTLLTRQK